MRVQEVETGLWRWTGHHPDWTPDQNWDPEVGCVYFAAPDAVVLIDPVVPPEDVDRFWEALDRDVARASLPVHVLLTVHWHCRNSVAVCDRYGGEIWAHEKVLTDTPREIEPTKTFTFDDTLPGGIVACDPVYFLESVFWLPGPGALVFGDIVTGADGELRLCPDDWLGGGASGDDLRTALRPLLQLPVHHVLVSHGEPVLHDGRTALARLVDTHGVAPSAA
jgi:hypothetical protein